MSAEPWELNPTEESKPAAVQPPHSWEVLVYQGVNRGGKKVYVAAVRHPDYGVVAVKRGGIAGDFDEASRFDDPASAYQSGLEVSKKWREKWEDSHVTWDTQPVALNQIEQSVSFATGPSEIGSAIWNIKKDAARGGYTIRVIHRPSGQWMYVALDKETKAICPAVHIQNADIFPDPEVAKECAKEVAVLWSWRVKEQYPNGAGYVADVYHLRRGEWVYVCTNLHDPISPSVHFSEAAVFDTRAQAEAMARKGALAWSRPRNE